MPRLSHDRYEAELKAETARFAAAVRDADPAQPVPTCPAWTVGQLTAHVGFGHRWAAVIVERRATGPVIHDTLVHRLDAELAVGRAVGALAPDLAADSVSDLLDMFRILPRVDDFPALAPLRGNGQTLHFHATDDGLGVAGEWLARRTPTGVAWEHGHGRADVAVRGRAVDLLLVLSRRVAPDGSGLEVSGDERLIAHWLEHGRLDPA
jgi:MDMPI C-terminal domain/Mycothiol maleylpyruvate isomerase N-terminal domain